MICYLLKVSKGWKATDNIFSEFRSGTKRLVTKTISRFYVKSLMSSLSTLAKILACSGEDRETFLRISTIIEII